MSPETGTSGFSSDRSAAIVGQRLTRRGDPRVAAVLLSVVEHLHELIKALEPTVSDWRQAVGFLHYRTLKPAGYSAPDDGPVGQLLGRFGYPLRRPAHLHYRISAAELATASPYPNPRLLTREDIRALLEDAFTGRRPNF